MILTNSYFSGGGLFDLGLLNGGLHLQQSFEIDPVCCATQRLNFSHEIVECDISNKTVLEDKECAVMVATYPCTRYSTAADLHGTRTGDSLFLHFFRHIALRRPDIYVVENVPGMRKFPIVMEAMSKLPDYYVSVFCPVNADIWLPQKRKRLILIGSQKNFAWRPPYSSKQVMLKDVIDENPDVVIPEYVYKRINGSYRDQPIISDPEKGDLAPTAVAHYAKDQSTRLLKDSRFPHGVRPYSPREYARLQGVPDSFRFSGSRYDIYRQVGNGVPVPMGEWVAQEIQRYFKGA
jgi:DNA (cytosine-5)-methyltransferase 1